MKQLIIIIIIIINNVAANKVATFLLRLQMHLVHYAGKATFLLQLSQDLVL